MDGESDAELVARARKGQAEALEALVRRYLRPAYAVALSVVRNGADAEDLAQEAMMRALQRLEQCRDPQRFAAWLLQAVRHRALNQLQQGKSRAALLDSVERGAVMEVDPSRVLVKEQLLGALGQLNEVQREVVLLHDLQSWTHAEIAGALGISEVMSRQHLFVARKVMRAHLAQGVRGAGGTGHG